MGRVIFCVVVLFLSSSCGEDSPGSNPPEDTFNRASMLEHWADDLILPGWRAMSLASAELELRATAFTTAPDLSSLESLRQGLEEAMICWQRVSMYGVGKADVQMTREYINLYPINTEKLDAFLLDRPADLSLPSHRDAQGFQALDYLLYGVRSTDQEIVDLYTEQSESRELLAQLTDRIHALVSEIYNEWSDSALRTDYISNTGNTISSSVNETLNAYLFYYERYLRAGKLGIPAGVFSATPLPGHVESRYRGRLSKRLLLEALTAVELFYSGVGADGVSLDDYLRELDTNKDGQSLDATIRAGFTNARAVITRDMEDDLETQLMERPQTVLAAYDALQAMVVLLKVDMLQAMNVSVVYVDADGD